MTEALGEGVCVYSFMGSVSNLGWCLTWIEIAESRDAQAELGRTSKELGRGCVRVLLFVIVYAHLESLAAKTRSHDQWTERGCVNVLLIALGVDF